MLGAVEGRGRVYPAEEVFLEVEFSRGWSFGFNDFEDLKSG